MTAPQPDTLTGVGDVPHYRETQTASDWWLYKLTIVVTAVGMGSSGIGSFRTGALWMGLLCFGLGLIMAAFIWALRLETVVRRDAVYSRVWPLHLSFRKFAWGDMDRHEAVTYRPIRDYGGWGIRLGKEGWAYNMYGKRGVLLHLRSGKTQLIGSQRPEELAAAITRAKSH